MCASITHITLTHIFSLQGPLFGSLWRSAIFPCPAVLCNYVGSMKRVGFIYLLFLPISCCFGDSHPSASSPPTREQAVLVCFCINRPSIIEFAALSGSRCVFRLEPIGFRQQNINLLLLYTQIQHNYCYLWLLVSVPFSLNLYGLIFPSLHLP